MLLLEDHERQEGVEDGEGETDREAKPVETGNTTMSVAHFKHINMESEAENSSEH